MKRLITGIIAASVLAITGCGGPAPVKDGSVIHLNFTPAHSENQEVTDYSMICTGGQYITCFPIVIGSHIETTNYPDHWQAELLKCNDKGSCRTGSVDISHTEYNNWQIGTVFPIQRTLDQKYGAKRQWG